MFAFNTTLGRAIRLPLKAIPPDSVVRILSGPNRGSRWIVGSHTHGCWLGSYERSHQRFIATHVRPGMTVFDAGANVGFFTLLLSRLVGPQGRVFAFEPDCDSLRFLYLHLELNEIRNVTVIEAALADRVSEAQFDGSGPYSRISANGRTIKTTQLDAYPVPDFVKMDIEGGETLALSACPDLLAKHKTTWFVSLHNDTCEPILRDSHYKIERLSADQICAFPD